MKQHKLEQSFKAPEESILYKKEVGSILTEVFALELSDPVVSLDLKLEDFENLLPLNKQTIDEFLQSKILKTFKVSYNGKSETILNLAKRIKIKSNIENDLQLFAA